MEDTVENCNGSFKSDATAAYRGYRLQSLYILWRILSDNVDMPLEYQPEGIEDLAILDEANNPTEIMQVKAFSGNLTLSNLSPKKDNSFLKRILPYIKQSKKPKVSLVSFGPLGTELQAWAEKSEPRKSLNDKLADYDFTPSEIQLFFDNIKIIAVAEQDLYDKVYAILKEIVTGIDPDIAFDLLNHWIYKCSERKDKITKTVLIEMINAIGKFLSERAAYHQEWFTSIIPLEDNNSLLKRDDLAEEFYAGVSVRYEHILSELDVIRYDKLTEIKKALSQNNIVIIHGASGQGKSALAYRYLHDFFPNKWRFAVKVIQDRIHAMSVARALEGHANALGMPMVVYVDVTPKDVDWTNLVIELSHNKNFQVIITIREEDWRRATLSKSGVRFTDIELSFDKSEASNIYHRLSQFRTIAQFIDFEDAWVKFGEAGPLLEFVHLITQGFTLRSRLEQQVKRLQDEARAGIEPRQIDMLRIVSIASAYGARLKTKELVDSLNLNSHQRTLELLEKEYLIRRTENGYLVGGLHPIRSSILSEILTDDLVPWSESACQCLTFMCEDDIESFLLYSFSRQDNKSIDALIDYIDDFQPKTWVENAGVLRSLLWLGIKEYCDENMDLIRSIYDEFGSGWWMLLNYDISDAMPGEDLVSNSGEMFSDDHKRRIEKFRAQQSSKERVYKYIRKWLSGLVNEPNNPESDSDWEGLAETIFWSGRLSANLHIAQWVDNIDLEKTKDTLSVSILADIALGLYTLRPNGFDDWFKNNRQCIVDRFRQEAKTLIVEDDGKTAKAHFIVDLAHNQKDEKGNHVTILNDQAVERLWVLRKVFPDRESFATQGYGHQISQLETPYGDPTVKDAPIRNLPIPWLANINAKFLSLASYNFRPETWADYANQLFNLRQNALNCLEKLRHALIVYLRKEKSIQLFDSLIDKSSWNQCWMELSNPPRLPKCAVDEWGFSDESSSQTRDNLQSNVVQLLRKPLGLQKYRPFIQTTNDFTSRMHSFLDQALVVVTYDCAIAKKGYTEPEKKELNKRFVEAGFDPNIKRLSVINLSDALNILPTFQFEFNKSFSRFIFNDELGKLERKELSVFRQILPLWHAFAFSPEKIWSNAEQESEQEISRMTKSIRSGINRFFRNSKDDIKLDLISKNVAWDNEPVVWLTFDVEHASDIYSAFEIVISGLKEGIGKADYPQLKRLILDLEFPRFGIIPLVRGKCISQNAWKIPNYALLDKGLFEGKDWWNYVPQPVSDDAWNILKLSCWQNPDLEYANQLVVHFATLSLFASHISDFSNLPDLDDIGMEILEEHLNPLSERIEEELQAFFDIFTIILDKVARLQSDEMNSHPCLAEAIKLMRESFDALTLDSNGDHFSISLSKTPEWAERFFNTMPKMESIRLYLIDDIINSMSV